MFRIKVCGVTSPEDAAMATEAGADAVGINFYRESARYVPVPSAAAIVEAIRGRGTAVAVFVNERPSTIEAICGELGIAAVQLSGDEPAEVAARIRVPLIRTVHVGSGSGLDVLPDYPCAAFLIDAAVPGKYGGTGRSLDWNALGRSAGGPYLRIGGDPSAGPGKPWMLAGGLTPENVAEAIRVSRPFGVDVASGVESAPGKKDPGKTRAFVENAKKGFGRAGIGR